MSDFFKDLPLNLTPNPITGDVPVAKNETAVKKALINLIRSPKGSKPFDPAYGSPVFNYLFSQADEQSRVELNEEIAEVIRKYEPRAFVIAIETKLDEDYGIEVIVEYYVKNSPQLQTLTTNISRTS
jgi:phage baseplate assembly protein W